MRKQEHHIKSIIHLLLYHHLSVDSFFLALQLQLSRLWDNTIVQSAEALQIKPLNVPSLINALKFIYHLIYLPFSYVMKRYDSLFYFINKYYDFLRA
jgi:hypothetical protein